MLAMSTLNLNLNAHTDTDICSTKQIQIHSIIPLMFVYIDYTDTGRCWPAMTLLPVTLPPVPIALLLFSLARMPNTAKTILAFLRNSCTSWLVPFPSYSYAFGCAQPSAGWLDPIWYPSTALWDLLSHPVLPSSSFFGVAVTVAWSLSLSHPFFVLAQWFSWW